MTTSGAPRLPDFPWDSLAGAAATARTHRDGVVDLSVGTPVDDVPTVVADALRSAWNTPGYPQTHGTPALRAAAVAALSRRHGATALDPDAVLPTVGSKELVAWLPTLLGLGAGDLVEIPDLAYPTYEVGALLAGATPRRVSDGASQPPSDSERTSSTPGVSAPGRDDGGSRTPSDSDGTSLTSGAPTGAAPRLVWLNSPSNPTGRVLSVDEMAQRVAAARAVGAVVASDECYLALPGPGAEPVSVLDPRVHGGSLEGLLAVHSLSKSSNLAGYRAAFVAGDPALVARLLATRKHAGMIVPRPVQEAMTAALTDDDHVAATRARYDARRAVLAPALATAGLRVDHSEAGLYLWATADEPCRTTVDRLAGHGILVAPGEFYGPAGARHVRVALTATDERIAAAAARLAE